MPTHQPARTTDDPEAQRRRQQQAVLAGHVQRALDQAGTVGRVERVDVRRLWEDHYRVNVFVGEDAVTSRICQSYFLVTDGSGNILSSTPRMGL
jgi:hypothetical protein